MSTSATRRLAWATVALVLVVGIVLRFVQRSDLWLDEALSVNIARLPIGDLPDALRADGHPPLYYALLHGWMRVFGDGDVAVRALSGIISVASLPLAWLVGRRVAGQAGALALLLLLASSPYAIRYATEARMYSLAMLLVLLGWLAVDAALRSPTPARLLAVAAVAGLLLLTHYWAIWLLGAVGLLLLLKARRDRSGAPAGRVAVAVVAGSALFTPWVPIMLHQAQHTGTPWGSPARPPAALAMTLLSFGGGDPSESLLLASWLVILALLGLLATGSDAHRLSIDLRTTPTVRRESLVIGGTLVLGLGASLVVQSAYQSRYAAVVLPLFLAMGAAGLATFLGPRARGIAAALAVGPGLVLGLSQAVDQPRTQAGQIVDAIVADGAASGDLVVICPDQLGPAVERLLPDGLVALAYPTLGSPAFVDWEDYEERNSAADPAAIAAEVSARADPDATVYLVTSTAYRTFEGQCEALASALSAQRPGGRLLVGVDTDFFESASLLAYG